MLFTQRWTRCLVVSASLTTPMTHALGDDTPQTLSFQGARGIAVENRGTTVVETSIAPPAAADTQRRPSTEQIRRMRDATQMARRLAQFGDDAFQRGLMPLGDYLEQLSLVQEVELRAAEMLPGGSVQVVRQQQVERLEQVVSHLQRFRTASGPVGAMEASRSFIYEAHGLPNATSPGAWSDAGQLARTQRHAALPVSIPHPAAMSWSSDLEQAEWELANARLNLADAQDDEVGKQSSARQRASVGGAYNVQRQYDAALGWANSSQSARAVEMAAESVENGSPGRGAFRDYLSSVAAEGELRSQHGRIGSVASPLIDDQQEASGRPLTDRVAIAGTSLEANRSESPDAVRLAQAAAASQSEELSRLVGGPPGVPHLGRVASAEELRTQLPAASRVALVAAANRSEELAHNNMGMGRADRVAKSRLDVDLVDLDQAVASKNGPRISELSARASQSAAALFAAQSGLHRRGTASLYDLAKTWRTWRVIDRSGIAIDEIVLPDAAPRTQALGELTAVADETADLRGRNAADVTVVRLLAEVNSLDALETPTGTNPEYLQ